jgi:hypothetical protein
MTIKDLSSMRPGERVSNLHFTHGNAVTDDFTLNEGIVSKESDLSDKDAAAYVVVDSGGNSVVAVALEHIDGREADIGIQSMVEGASEDPELIYAAAEAALHRKSLKVGRLAQEVGDIAQATQVQAGFLPDSSGTPELFV